MGSSDQDIYYSMLRNADAMAKTDAPWLDVQEAYLKAWEFRPTRAEALYAVARRYQVDKRYRAGYLFAKKAAEIPLPQEDVSDADADIYAWRATDEQAVCAYWLHKHAEAFTLNRRLLARPGIPDVDRRRIAKNRDFSVHFMVEKAASYPDVLTRNLIAAPRDAEVTVSLVAGSYLGAAELTLNSFLTCCLDVSRVGRFVVVDAGLSAEDRAILSERYGFLEFVGCGSVDGPGFQLAQIRDQIEGRFWLHLGEGWQFFAPENFITRLTAVLEAEPKVFQVGINVGDAVKLTGASAAEQVVHRTPDAGRYVVTDAVARGPAMLDCTRLGDAGGMQGTDPKAIAELGQRAAAAGLQTASLDEVLCITSFQS